MCVPTVVNVVGEGGGGGGGRAGVERERKRERERSIIVELKGGVCDGAGRAHSRIGLPCVCDAAASSSSAEWCCWRSSADFRVATATAC